MLIIRLKMTELLLSDNKMISKYIYRFIIVKNKNPIQIRLVKSIQEITPYFSLVFPVFRWSFR